MNGINIGLQTLIGSFGNYPRKHGNCFSMGTDNNDSVRIVNFLVENLEYLLKKKWITYPIKLKSLSDRSGVAIIDDDRIPETFYRKLYCTVCCPSNLLLQEQQDERQRQIESGELIIRDGIEIRKVKATTRKLNAEWTIEPQQDLVSYFGKSVFDAPIVYVPYTRIHKKT
jgi:hypothetical protein